MKRIFKVEKICLFVVALVLVGLTGPLNGTSIDGFSVSDKESKTKPWDGTWSLDVPEHQGFNVESLERSVVAIGGMKGVYSLLVARNRVLVVERYFREGSRTKPHNIKSATKSILSALVGIAVDQGLLRPDQTIGDFLPRVNRLADKRKQHITVQHLLTMTSGLEQTSYQAYNSWVSKGDWVITILNRPLSADPGTRHQYSTGDTHILSAVLTAAAGLGLKDFAGKYLFDPLGIKVHDWGIDPKGIQQGGNNLSLVPRDMAKFGQLYLDKGQFYDKRIVPEWWVDASTRPNYLGSHEIYGYYGYLWYTRPGGNHAFVAVGYGGQYIYVSPVHNSVVVVTSTLESKGPAWEKQLFNTIQDHLLAGITIREGLENLDGRGRLGSKLGYEAPAALVSIPKGIVLSNLNLRKGPGIKEQKLVMLTPGTVLKVLDRTSSWLKVSADGELGWVAAEYVRIVSPDRISFKKNKPDIKEKTEGRVSETDVPISGAVVNNADAVVELKDFKAFSNELEDRLNIYESKVLQFEGLLNIFQNDWAGQRKSVEDLSSVWGSLTTDLGGVHSRISTLGKAVNGSLTGLDQQTKEIDAVRDQLDTFLSNLDAGINRDKKQQDQIKVDVDQLKKELADHKRLFNGMLSSGKAFETAITGTHQELKEALEGFHREFKDLRMALDGSNQRLDRQQTRLGQDLIRDRDALKSLEQKLQFLETSRHKMALDLKKLGSAVVRQTDSSGKEPKDDKEVRSQLAELGNRHSALDERVEKFQQTWDDEKKKSFTGVYGQLISLKVAAQKDAEQRNSLEARVNSEISALRDDLTIIKKTSIDSCFNDSAVKQELALARQEISSLKSELEEAALGMKLLATDLSWAKKELKKLGRVPVVMAVEQQQDSVFAARTEIVKKSDGTSKALMHQKRIAPFVLSWAGAWEKQDVNNYLSHYSKLFKPSKGRSLDHWTKLRKKRILKPTSIRIAVSGMKTSVADASHGSAVFTQTYRSNRHGDTVVKTLELVWEKDGWKIIRESSKES